MHVHLKKPSLTIRGVPNSTSMVLPAARGFVICSLPKHNEHKQHGALTQTGERVQHAPLENRVRAPSVLPPQP